MARKFEAVPGKFCWNPERCEEILIIAAYNQIASYIPPEQQWGRDFEMYFYERGGAIGSHSLGYINDARRRKKLKPLVLVETDIGDYAREMDKMVRAERRRQLRDQLADMNAKQLAEAVALAHREMMELPPPHKSYHEWADERDVIDEQNRASREEVTRRHAAASARQNGNGNGICATSPPPETGHNGKPLTKIIKMLSLATDPDLHRDIIEALSGEEALTLAEQIEVPDLRNALVRRSLTAMV